MFNWETLLQQSTQKWHISQLGASLCMWLCSFTPDIYTRAHTTHTCKRWWKVKGSSSIFSVVTFAPKKSQEVESDLWSGERAFEWVLCSHSLMKTEGEPKVCRGVRAVKAEQEAVLVQRIDRRSFWQDASGMKYKEQWWKNDELLSSKWALASVRAAGTRRHGAGLLLSGQQQI